MLRNKYDAPYNIEELAFLNRNNSKMFMGKNFYPDYLQELLFQQIDIEHFAQNQNKLSMFIRANEDRISEESSVQSSEITPIWKDDQSFSFQSKISDEKQQSSRKDSCKVEDPVLEEKLRRKKRFIYQFDSDQMEHSKKRKLSETKNIVKSYSNAIFRFLEKKKDIKRKFLEKLGIDEEDFQVSIKQVRGKIFSISDLRDLWTVHKYSKALRMLSEEYIRKHSLEHIFHGRVLKLQNHLKYRSKILRSIRNPEAFTFMKQF